MIRNLPGQYLTSGFRGRFFFHRPAPLPPDFNVGGPETDPKKKLSGPMHLNIEIGGEGLSK